MMRGICLSFLLLALMSGCNKAEVQVKQEVKEENAVTGILEQLQQERPNLQTYRSVVEQLNSHYDQGAGSKVLAMAPDQEAVLRQMLTEIKADFERARRVDETKSRLFSTFADASYIDACLLFRDSLNSLTNDLGDIPPKSNSEAVTAYQMEQVKHLHGWVMRQVALRNNPANIKEWPAHEILRLGQGDAEDRLRVFLSLLNQSDLDGCAVAIKTQVKNEGVVENRQVPILAGVLIGKNLYLFDPFKGQPVMVPGTKNIATLEEVKKNPGWLAHLPEAPTATQLAESELVLLTSLNGLAPRMETLEKEFDNLKITVKLKDDAAGRIERFKTAGFTVKPWSAPNRQGFPALVFQKYVEGTRGDPRLTDVILPRKKLIPQWALDAEQQIGLPGTAQSLFSEFDRLFINLRLEPGSGRDLLVRGKAHQAVARFSTYENRLDRSLDSFHRDMAYTIPGFRDQFVPGLVERCQMLRKISQDMAALPKGSAEERQMDIKRRTMYMQIENACKDTNIKNMIANLGADWAVPELREHLSYFMGLAKMELALRAEMRYRRNPKATWPSDSPTPAEQYASAAEWFRRYEALVIPMKSNIWLDAVKLRRSECLAKEKELTALVAQAR